MWVHVRREMMSRTVDRGMFIWAAILFPLQPQIRDMDRMTATFSSLSFVLPLPAPGRALLGALPGALMS